MIAKSIAYRKLVLAKIIYVKLIYLSKHSVKLKKVLFLDYPYYIKYNSIMMHEKSGLLQMLIHFVTNVNADRYKG